MSADEKSERALGHFIATIREVGALLIAFGPLETAINRSGGALFALFLILGVLIFGVALVLEWKYEQ